MSALLKVRSLRMLRGGRVVVDVPTLAIAPGEVLAVVGPNGAGKSSLLHALALLEPAEFESYEWAGRAVRLPGEALALRRQMAVVFQEPLLLDATVYENVVLGPKLRGIPGTVARERALALLKQLEILHLADRPAHQISGGEAQRVSLARALAVEPRLLFLDEPFVSLDVLTRRRLVRDLREALRRQGIAALFVTHDFAEVPPLADRVAVMFEGRIVQIGTPHDVFARPATPAVRELVEVAHDLVRSLQPDRVSEGR